MFGTPAAPIDLGGSDRDERLVYLLEVAGFLGLFLLAQWCFLLPRGRLTFRTVGEGRPMKRAALGAAFAGMLLTVAAVATVLEMFDKWRSLAMPEGSGIWAKAAGGERFWVIWLVMLLVWGAWALIFHHLWRNLDHRTAVSRTTRALLAGSLLELLVAGPVHAWVARKDDCYCARGSYTGLVFGATVLIWAFSPGVFLLAMREKKRVRG
jgi:hypothetical protein